MVLLVIPAGGGGVTLSRVVILATSFVAVVRRVCPKESPPPPAACVTCTRTGQSFSWWHPTRLEGSLLRPLPCTLTSELSSQTPLHRKKQPNTDSDSRTARGGPQDSQPRARQLQRRGKESRPIGRLPRGARDGQDHGRPAAGARRAAAGQARGVQVRVHGLLAGRKKVPQQL